MRMMFVNLPVRDLRATMAFFAGLGFEFNLEFTGDSCACMVVDRNIFVMLLAEDRFRDFINGDISDARTSTEVLTCLSADTREYVEQTVAKALAAGGKPWKPTFEEGPMY